MCTKDMSVRLETLRGRLRRFVHIFCTRNDVTGTRYITASNYHWTERLFWLFIHVIALMLSIALSVKYMKYFDDTAVTVMNEDLPITTSVFFPSVGLCAEATWQYPPNLRAHLRHGDEEFHQFVLMLLYQDLYEPHALEQFYNHTLGLPATEAAYYNDFNYTDLAIAELEHCPSFFSECSFFGRSFNCCANFLAEPSMIGGCFLFDGINGRKQFLNLSTFRKIQHLRVKVLRPTKVFVLEQQSLPDPFSRRQHIRVDTPGADANIPFMVNPQVNDNDIVSLPIEVLKCYTGANEYGDQFEPRNSEHISLSGCLRSCVMRWQLMVCDCLSWNFRPESGLNGAFCTLRGYVCLERHGLFHFRQMDRNIIRSCRCLLMCTAQSVTIPKYENKDTQVGTPLRSINISMFTFPRYIYRRQLVRSNMDIVVSIGSIISLTLGVNLISLCSLVYTMLQTLIQRL